MTLFLEIFLQLFGEALLNVVTFVAAEIVVPRSGPPSSATHYWAEIKSERQGILSLDGKNRAAFFCTFATQSGDREVAVTPTDYAHLSEGQKGVLTIQGGSFRSFQPERSMRSAETARYLKNAADAPTHVA